MRAMCCALLVAGFALGQQTPANQPQLTPDQQLSMMLTQYDRLKVMGDLDGAIRGYREALARVKSEAPLKNREEEVLQHLASAYIAAKRPKEAVQVDRRILGFHDEDCKPGAPGVERCADAQYGLGLAMMYAGDFPGAVTLLSASAANFARVNMQGDEPYRMTKLKQRGDAESMLAAALFRSGQREKALAAFRKAIATLKTVADNQKMDPGTRGSALKSMQDAEASLKMLENDQPGPAPAK